ncbi:MAG: dipeptidase [Halieaceae bacterium]|nr:dipeptidase [Halieaceae bacterium]
MLNTRPLPAVLCIIALLVAPVPALADKFDRQAKKLTQKYLLADGHIDVPIRLHYNWQDVTEATESGQFDYPRAKEGGLNLPFMSIYTPADSEYDGSAYAMANNLIDHVEAIVARAPDRFAIASSTAAVEQQFKEGKISLALGMENGAPISGSLDNLRHFHARGVRYVTLAHSHSNHISDSSYDTVRLWQGLSPFGRKVVAEMNALGIMVDISHLSDKAAYEVLEISKVPVIASHSSARHFVDTQPVFERNMDDELIKALAANDGVIMINFGSGFLTTAAAEYRNQMRPAMTAFGERHGAKRGDPRMRQFIQDYQSIFPYPYATVSDVADHIDHVVKLVGIEHVGIGSDYDGVGDTLPIGLKDVSTYPNLVAELLRRDYSESDIEKLLGGNLMRVWKAVEREAG